MTRSTETPIYRNDPCPCGSGLKYKKCCLDPRNRKTRRFDPSIPQDKSPFSLLLRISAILSLIVAGLIAYSNIYHNEFIFDDLNILEYPALYQLWPLTDVFHGSNRPILNLSFAINYAFGQVQVWGYHAFNVFVHILAAITLFAILRRTLLNRFFTERYPDLRINTLGLAWAISLLWLIHPLQTASVTYVSQRAEALMGLFYLLTLYSTCRYIESRENILWLLTAMTASALGMGTKEVMITAPLMCLIYDRLFYARSWRELFERRWLFYFGLGLTWLVPWYLLTHTKNFVSTAGFHLKDFTPLQYAMTQPEVIGHYLKLVFWPASMCLDYGWQVARSLGSVGPYLIGLCAALGLTIVGLFKKPALGFLGLWFFGILSVTSSFIPIQDIAFDHRMYLPSIAVIAGLVLAGSVILKRFIPSQTTFKMIFSALTIGLAAFGTGMTIERNKTYQNNITAWSDVVKKRPSHWRGYNNLALALIEQGKYKTADDHLKKAIEIKSDNVAAYVNWGLSCYYQEKFEEAIRHLSRALEIDPKSVDASYHLGLVYAKMKDYAKAASFYLKAIALNNQCAEAYNNYGVILIAQGKLDEALEMCRQAIKLRPHYAAAYCNLGVAYIQKNDISMAEKYFLEAIKVKPDYAKAYNNLGAVNKEKGRFDLALKYFKKALELLPDYPDAQKNLARLTEEMKKQK